MHIPTSALNGTAHKILDAAEQFTQIQGFNAFSYKDLQREVGIKTSSIHYYFPTKNDLALALTERYTENFQDTLDNIRQREAKGLNQLQALIDIFAKVLKEGKLCMCGMLASDMVALPENVHSKLATFFILIESWVIHAIQLGQQQKEIKPDLEQSATAAHFLATLEGGMIVMRAQNNAQNFEIIMQQVLSHLKA